MVKWTAGPANASNDGESHECWRKRAESIRTSETRATTYIWSGLYAEADVGPPCVSSHVVGDTCKENRLSPRCCRILLTMMICAVATPAPAQDTLPQFQPGTRVRIELLSPKFSKLVGDVIASTTDTIALANAWRGPRYLSRADMWRVSEFAGRNHLRGTLKGAGWGLLAGGLSLGLAVAGSYKGDDFYFSSRAEAFAGGFIAGGLLGAVPGALIGAIRGSDTWRTRWERP